MVFVHRAKKNPNSPRWTDLAKRKMLNLYSKTMFLAPLYTLSSVTISQSCDADKITIVRTFVPDKLHHMDAATQLDPSNARTNQREG